ncbi:uncharacterized protein [Diadema setosum]|uniref:uncharacterized protein n=1 Tax=Diadema setosum TaxID=31175 RepID=UPI003B3B7CCE
MADAFVRDKLRRWNLGILLDAFEENAIDYESFHLLDFESIKEMIPKVGLRLKFLNHHKTYMEKKSHVMPQPHLPKETKQHTAVRTSPAASSRASPDLSASLVTTSSSSSTPAQRFVPVTPVTPAPSAPTTSEPSSVISAPSTGGRMLAGRGTNWSDRETRFLLKQWSSKAVQERLDGTVRDARVYQSLSEAMHRAGFPRSASQLRVKLKQCKQNYRIARLENKKKGCITVGPCYQILHSVLGEEDPILLRKLALQTGADSDVNGENFGPNMSSSGQAEFDNFPPDEDQEDDSVEESRNSFPAGVVKLELPDGMTYMMEEVNDLPSPPSDSMCGDSQSPQSDLNAAPSPGYPPSSSLSTLDRSLPPDPVPEFDIRDILGKHSSGRSIMHELDTEDKPSTAVRHSLVRILVDHLVKNYGWYPASDVKSSLAKALVIQFPSLRDHSAEGYESFYTWSKSSAESQINYTASGSLESRLRNWRNKHHAEIRGQRSDLKATPAKKGRYEGSMTVSGARGDYEICVAKQIELREMAINPEMELSSEELEAKVQWLQEHTEPRETVHALMRATAGSRLRWRTRNPSAPITELLDRYPRLLDSQGIIDQDFRLLFPSHADKLSSTWTDTLVNIILQYADIAHRTLSNRLGINQSVTSLTDSEERSNIAFQVLPYILPTNQNIRSANQRASFFIDIQPDGTDPQHYLNDIETSEFPFLLLIGSRLAPTEIYVVFQDNAMIERNIVEAVDECFKLFHILGIPYPKQCMGTWEFIQKILFQLPDLDGWESPVVEKLHSHIQQQIFERCTENT